MTKLSLIFAILAPGWALATSLPNPVSAEKSYVPLFEKNGLIIFSNSKVIEKEKWWQHFPNQGERGQFDVYQSKIVPELPQDPYLLSRSYVTRVSLTRDSNKNVKTAMATTLHYRRIQPDGEVAKTTEIDFVDMEKFSVTNCRFNGTEPEFCSTVTAEVCDAFMKHLGVQSLAEFKRKYSVCNELEGFSRQSAHNGMGTRLRDAHESALNGIKEQFDFKLQSLKQSSGNENSKSVDSDFGSEKSRSILATCLDEDMTALMQMSAIRSAAAAKSSKSGEPVKSGANQ